MVRPIIVPLDGSQLSEAALPWAIMLARTQHVPITLVRAVDFPIITAGEFDYLPPEVYDKVLEVDRGAAQSYLEQVGQRLAADGVTANWVVRTGTPAESIHDLADEIGASAIAMASHGRAGMARLLLGSTAERVLQQATIPVMIVRANNEKPSSAPAFRRIIVPLDGSALAERGLDFAQTIATPDSTVVLVRVVEPVMQMLAGTEGTLIPDETATQSALAEATGYLNGTAPKLEQAGFTVERHVRLGRAGDEITAVMRESNADLVIMTTHGRTGAERWILGSIADHLVRHADRPVLLVSARTLTARIAGPYKVADLMTRDLATVRRDEPLAVAARKLLRRRVSGAPVVNAQGELVGVLSEHDLLAWHARVVESLSRDDASLDPTEYARRFESDSVDQLMTHPPISIDEDASLIAAVDVFLERRLRRLPVTRDGKLAGIISRADILRAMAQRDEANDELFAADPLVSSPAI